MKDVGIFYEYLVFLRPAGIFYGHVIYFFGNLIGIYFLVLVFCTNIILATPIINRLLAASFMYVWHLRL
jgi:hypothetical protein